MTASGAQGSPPFPGEKGQGPTPDPWLYLFFFAAFFLVVFFATFFVLVFAVAFFFAALGLGMDFGLQSRDRVVARRPQLSQKYFNSIRFG